MAWLHFKDTFDQTAVILKSWTNVHLIVDETKSNAVLFELGGQTPDKPINNMKSRMKE